MVASHYLLGKLFGRLDTSSGFGMPENRHVLSMESIDYTCSQSGFGSYYREIDLMLFGERQQTLHIGIFERYALGLLSDARIARGTVDLGYLRTLGQSVHDSVLAPATAHY